MPATTATGPVADLTQDQIDAEFSHIIWTSFSGQVSVEFGVLAVHEDVVAGDRTGAIIDGAGTLLSAAGGAIRGMVAVSRAARALEDAGGAARSARAASQASRIVTRIQAADGTVTRLGLAMTGAATYHMADVLRQNETPQFGGGFWFIGNIRFS